MDMDKAINRSIDIIFRVAVLIIPLVILYMGIGLILAYPLMWLWNFTIPDISNGMFNGITYWQAWAIIVMFSILFGGGSRD